MISESSFAAVFGAPVPGGEDSLVHLARYAIRAGFAIVPCLPGTKQPMCTLASRDVKRADTEAQEAARAAGMRRWDQKRHDCGVKHALTDEKRSDAVIRRLIRDYGRVNLGVELGVSRVIVVDVDTDAEKEAFAASWLASTGEPLPFGMTVQSPGVVGIDGAWKHKNGGHYWFALPEGFVLPADDGAMKDPTGWIAMWANRQVLVPPSVRDEGPYLLIGDIHPAPLWLMSRVVDYITERRTRAQARAERLVARSATGETAHIDSWSTAVSWTDLLEPDGWYDTTLLDNCGCSIWTAPGVHASPKSATAHDVGCALYDDSPGHAPLHVWTDNPPEFLITGDFGKTFTKIQYVALRDHSGSIPQACRAEGIEREGGAQLIAAGDYIPDRLGGPLTSNGMADLQPPSGSQLGHVMPESRTTDLGATSGSGLQTLPTPEYETWAAEHEDQLTNDELLEAGYEQPRLHGLPPPPRELPAAPTLGLPVPPSTGEGAPAPVVEDPFERQVRLKLTDRIVAAEADRLYAERRYPFAAKVATRGFESMRDIIKSAAETPASFLVERWLRKGSYGVIGAEYKAGKTFLAVDMALSIATGTPFLGIVPTSVGRVAMMHNEGDKVEFVERLRAVAAAKGILLTDEVLDRLMLQEGASKLDQPDAVNRLYENLEVFSPDLLLIDPWYMSAGEEGDGKTISKMGVVLGNLQGVAHELGSALLITAHWNKSGDGKGVSRWSGSGLAEWGRVLINVAVDKYMPARPYADDPTGRTAVDLSISLAGQTSGNYRVHREVWREDAKELTTRMGYLVTSQEQEDAASESAPTVRDVTMGERERLLRVYAVSTAGLTKTKCIQTARGSTSRGRTMAIWNEAFDELVNAGHIEDLDCDLTATNTSGQERPGGYAKYAITKPGRDEITRLDQLRARGGSTERFTGLRVDET